MIWNHEEETLFCFGELGRIKTSSEGEGVEATTPIC